MIKNFREFKSNFTKIKYRLTRQNVLDEAFFFKESCSLDNLPANDQNLVLVKEFIF